MTIPPWHNENVARDGAHVDQQNGINFGETTFHRHEYYTTDGPPEQRFRTAVWLLEAGMPRRAEDILDGLIRSGRATTEWAYYFMLALLGGRDYDEIGKAVYQKYKDARRTAFACAGQDNWTAAIEAIHVVMEAAQRQGARIADGDENLVVKQLDTLPDQQRGQIMRHLNRLLSGVVQDRLDRQMTEQVVTARMADDRVRRAWKFFEAVPAAPRPYQPPTHIVDRTTTKRAWAGGAATIIAALPSFWAGANIAGLLAALVLVGVGAGLAVRFGGDRVAPKYRAKRNAWENDHPAVAPVSPGHWVSTAFVKEIHERVDLCFRQARPHTSGQWEQDTRGIREYTKERFVAQFGNAQVSAASTTWLMRWHAKRVADLWRSGELAKLWAVSPPPAKSVALSLCGVVTAGAGVLTMALAGAVGTALLAGVGLFFAVAGAVEVRAARLDDERAKTENAGLFDEENRAYEQWQQVLSDRPTDHEMGQWFELDKAYLKRVALERCGLNHKDLVTYVVVTQGADDAMRARINKAPVRYSAYVVLVFLLTRSGVREIEVDLDFLTGKVHDERRTAFRYDSLASARVAEVGVRQAGDGAAFAHGDAPLEVARLRSREFRLSLVNGEDIRVKVENFRGLTDFAEEEEPALQRMALQVSGIAGAIHVLEAVAAEGGQWIDKEEERRSRRARDWYEYENGT